MTAALIAAVAIAAAQAIPMTADRWDVQGEAAFAVRDGRQAVLLGAPSGGKRAGAVANIKNLKFSTGIIEYDVWLPDAMEFSGPIFRQSAHDVADYIYFRAHQNGKPDAIQYTPIINGSLAWQIFTGAGYEAETLFPLERWAHVRLDVYQNSARLSVNGKSVLHMPALKSGAKSGVIGFGSLMGGTYYAGVTIQSIPGYADPEPAKASEAHPDGLVRQFEVSEALTYEDGIARASSGRWSGMPWHRIDVETNGIANLSKAGPDTDTAHTFIARFAIDSETARAVPMKFGFSDDVRLYLNGKPLYEGSDRQGSRDYRFLGHVGFWDTIFLDLNAGTNEVVFVVSDPTNGGTAAAAIVAPQDGVSVR